jgi:hypothetical protein
VPTCIPSIRLYPPTAISVINSRDQRPDTYFPCVHRWRTGMSRPRHIYKANVLLLLNEYWFLGEASSLATKSEQLNVRNWVFKAMSFRVNIEYNFYNTFQACIRKTCVSIGSSKWRLFIAAQKMCAAVWMLQLETYRSIEEKWIYSDTTLLHQSELCQAKWI